MDIKNQIIASLKAYPKTIHGVARDVDIKWETARNNLEDLAEFGKVSEFEKDGKRYWQVNS